MRKDWNGEVSGVTERLYKGGTLKRTDIAYDSFQ
jgi:hypothetical protein